MTLDRSDAIIVRETPVSGAPRRTRYEPRSDGRFDAVAEVWRGDAWQATGTEVVADLAIEGVFGEAGVVES